MKNKHESSVLKKTIKNGKFIIKKTLKMFLQNVLLPCVYAFWHVVYARKKPELLIFADSHHDTLPYSMMNMHHAIEEKGYPIVESFHNYRKMSQIKATLLAIRFMRQYAQAKYVFICDNFLPVVSCKKRKETMVIQLWHGGGLIKKFGYDTNEDIPLGYKGHVYKNYDLFTVSSPYCIDVWSKALHLSADVLKPMGISRTDNYFNEEWRETCRRNFYKKYPVAKGKKIILWAPTFRGNAGDPYLVGQSEIDVLEKTLGEEYYVIRKVHPAVDLKYHLSNCDIITEHILSVVDLLITDYSSIVCDYMFFHKPYVMFAPDLEEYKKTRGTYVAYESLSPYIVTDGKELLYFVHKAMADTNLEWVEKNRQYHYGSCDGNVTNRILEYIGL